MSKLTASESRIVASVLAALQVPQAQQPAAPKAKAARSKALPSNHPVVVIAKAKATKGKVVCIGAQLDIVRGHWVQLPEATARFTLSIGDKGWAFTPDASGKLVMSETPVTAKQAQAIRADKRLPATLSGK